MRIPAQMVMLLVITTWIVGCSGPDKQTSKSGVPSLPAPPGQQLGALQVEKGDINGDGKPDVWNYYKNVPDPAAPGQTKKVLVKKEADLDFDGRKDIQLEYNDNGILIRDRVDLDFDGNIDQENFYKGEVIVEKHVYRPGSDKILLWKYYKEGRLSLMKRDDDGDGKPDYCERWYRGQRLLEEGWDKDGDGECDYWKPYEE